MAKFKTLEGEESGFCASLPVGLVSDVIIVGHIGNDRAPHL
jgi:hypothetical protein